MDPARMKPVCITRVNRRVTGRVNRLSSVADRIGSGQAKRCSYFMRRVGSDRVNSGSNLTGRVGLGQLTRPDSTRDVWPDALTALRNTEAFTCWATSLARKK